MSSRAAAEDDEDEDEEKDTTSRRFRFAVALSREPNKRSLAAQHVDSLLKDCPDHAKAWALKSTMERESRVAVATAEKGYAARPELPATRRALCAALTRLDFEEQGSQKKRTSFSLLSRAADVCPDDARAQFRLGRAARQLKDAETARRAFRATLALDPAHERAAFWLAALGDADPPSRAPVDHLKALYDDYAPRYDDHLGKTLESRAPELVAAALAAHFPPPRQRDRTMKGIDLGCGTGLSGLALRDALEESSCSSRPGESDEVQWRGVDLSPRMAELAAKRGCYVDVRSMDLLDALEQDDAYDCLVSCDVLVYFGDLRPFFDAASRNAEKRRCGQLLALTLEDTDDGWDLTPTGRFRHSPDYVLKLAASAGWTALKRDQSVLRRQSGKPVLGRVYVFQFSSEDHNDGGQDDGGQDGGQDDDDQTTPEKKR